jgi:acyl-CoA synthetase (AMP-forming)/AMP-acid ligase II
LEHVDAAEALKIDNRLVAFVTPATADPELIIEAAMMKMPHYMVPSVIVPLAAFPLTGNGKVKIGY